MASVIIPPKMTDGINPMIFAARPDSNEPISLEDPIKMLFTEATLPRISSGATSCIVDARITTLILSNIPLNANNTIERKKFFDRAKQIMLNPKPVTPIINNRPALTVGGL